MAAAEAGPWLSIVKPQWNRTQEAIWKRHQGIVPVLDHRPDGENRI